MSLVVGAPDAPSRPRVLSIGGTDPTGGAGVQADLKAFAAHGAYGMAVVTALVAQNTQGVTQTHVPPTSFLRAQLDAVSDDVQIDAIKIGMLATVAVVTEVADWLSQHRPPYVVLDPVMVATSGHRLLDAAAEAAVRDLVGQVDLVTPNLRELAVLVDEPVALGWLDAIAQAGRLAARSGVTVLVKGGHLVGEPTRSPDAIVDGAGFVEVEGPRVATSSTHGTGCSFSSAITALRPRRDSWLTAVREAKVWLTGALEAGSALQVGAGAGPVDHFHHLSPGGTRFTAEAWEAIAELRMACKEVEFLRRLSDRSLPTEVFAAFLAQDALFLRECSRVLARASQLAPGLDAQEFFAHGAHQCLAVEAGLHRRWVVGAAVPGAAAPVVLSPVTAAYTSHLHRVSAQGSYAEVVAAVLPSYWLYAEIGRRLMADADLDGHPYGDWIRTYGGQDFGRAAERACAFVDAAAEGVGARERGRMLAAFVASSRHEWLVFEQSAAPMRAEGTAAAT